MLSQLGFYHMFSTMAQALYNFRLFKYFSLLELHYIYDYLFKLLFNLRFLLVQTQFLLSNFLDLFYNPILDARTSVCPPSSVTLTVTPWILKWGELGSSGLRPIFLYSKTKGITLYFIFRFDFNFYFFLIFIVIFFKDVLD